MLLPRQHGERLVRGPVRARGLRCDTVYPIHFFSGARMTCSLLLFFHSLSRCGHPVMKVAMPGSTPFGNTRHTRADCRKQVLMRHWKPAVHMTETPPSIARARQGRSRAAAG